MSKIILASKSPRRRQLLADLGLEFDVVAFDVNEDAPADIQAEELVRLLAIRKLNAVRDRIAYPSDTLIIAADTVVRCGGEIFGKPTDRADASRMIHAMSGRTHEVCTGIAVARGDHLTAEYERTVVFFRRLTENEIDFYVRNEFLGDKAGAYAVQGSAALFVERIEGDYYNIVGLPLCRLGVICRRDFGIDLSDPGRNKQH